MITALLARVPDWSAVGWTMLHMIWIGTAFGMVAAVGRRILRPARPETRYGFAVMCLSGLAVSPVVVFALLEHSESPSPAASRLTALTHPQAATASAQTVSPERVPNRGVDVRTVERPRRAWLGASLDRLADSLGRCWLGGSLVTLTMLVTGIAGVERLRRTSRVIEAGHIAVRCRTLADSLRIARRVGVGICDRIAAPVLIGIVRPMILLPPAALCGWSVEQMEMVLLHELAHLRRGDNLVNLAQRLVEALLFFHPVVWWVSSWVRLERELCCDRFVVARTGRATAYAEMLVALAGSSHGRRRIALAMADGQVLTRVRRILNLEERSMRVTMPEGVGVLSAAIVGVVLTLGVNAAAPPGKGDESETARKALRRAAEDVLAIRGKVPLNGAMQGNALVAVAEAQLKLGDREAAQTNLRKAAALMDRVDASTLLGEAGSPEWVAGLANIASLQHRADDAPAARKTLAAMVRLVETVQVDPAESSKVAPLNSEMSRVEHFSGKVAQAELFAVIALGWLEQGDKAQARALAGRATAAIRNEEGPLKPMLLTNIAVILDRSGDAAGARAAIDEALQAATRLGAARYRERALCGVVGALSQTGDLDGALRLITTFPDPKSRSRAFQKVLDSVAHDKQDGAWLKPGGLKIEIGAESYKVENEADARRDLPRLARAVREALDPLEQARTLSMIAHLQAKAGDFPGSLVTAESIPDLQRSDFPGPSDGYYDAIRPATLALIARLQLGAGDRASGRAGFRRARALCQAIPTEGEKIIAQIVIARQLAEAGEAAEAGTLRDEAVVLSLRQSEPRRSRCLAELTQLHLDAGDAPGAVRTAQAVRSYPGIEKLAVLGDLADWYEKAGDVKNTRAYLRQSLSCLEARASQDSSAKQAPPFLPNSFSAHTFMDPDRELDPRWLPLFLENREITLRARLGDNDGTLRAARALPEGKRDAALGRLVDQRAHQGDIAAALELASTLESGEGRLRAIVQTAYAVQGGFARK